MAAAAAVAVDQRNNHEKAWDEAVQQEWPTLPAELAHHKATGNGGWDLNSDDRALRVEHAYGLSRSTWDIKEEAMSFGMAFGLGQITRILRIDVPLGGMGEEATYPRGWDVFDEAYGEYSAVHVTLEQLRTALIHVIEAVPMEYLDRLLQWALNRNKLHASRAVTDLAEARAVYNLREGVKWMRWLYAARGLDELAEHTGPDVPQLVSTFLVGVHTPRQPKYVARPVAPSAHRILPKPSGAATAAAILQRVDDMGRERVQNEVAKQLRATLAHANALSGPEIANRLKRIATQMSSASEHAAATAKRSKHDDDDNEDA